MEEVILLLTNWEDKIHGNFEYWFYPKSAPFTGRQYNELGNWDKLAKRCPIPGLGIYISTQVRDCTHLRFVYIKIKGMYYDKITLMPSFDFDVIKKSDTQSKLLYEKLPRQNTKFFSSIDSDNLLGILKSINEEPPNEWLKLIHNNHSQIIVEQSTLVKDNSLTSDWKKHIGKYFIELTNNNIGNDEFEDRIAVLLKSLGFFVDKKGHEKYGEYPDGVAFHKEIGLVYDCKNRTKYFPTASDARAMDRYLLNEKLIHVDKMLNPVFIAKCFNHIDNKYFYFTVESLLYLLFKKLTLGPGFTLNPFNKLFSNKSYLSTELINNEWY